MTQTLFKHGHAILIGVGGNLPVTVHDATKLKELLIDPLQAAYPPDQVELLVETKATRGEIFAAFERVISRVGNDPEATVIVYFSGHGGRIAQPGTTPRYFLVPHGYDPSKRNETAISGQEFTDLIERIAGRKMVVLLDCCHAGGIPQLKGIEESFVKSPAPPELLAALERGTGRVVIASSREDEKSLAGPTLSIFTKYLLEGLAGRASVNKDGYARILDILIYLFKHVPEQTGQTQHPFVKKVLDLGDNFPLCYYAGGSKSLPDEPPIPEPSAATGVLTSGKRHRLQMRLEALQAEWNLIAAKVTVLRKALIVEAGAAVHFQLEQGILDEEKHLAGLTDEIEQIEQLLK